MQPDFPPPVLDEAHAAFVESGVSIVACGCDLQAFPTLVRALGCRVAPDRRTLTIFVNAAQAEALIQGVRANRRLAVVFSQPSSHRTIQLKGTDASVQPLAAGDLEIIEAHAGAVAADLACFGWPATPIRTLLSCPPEALAALQFMPTAAFTQTPGPKAGSPLLP